MLRIPLRFHPLFVLVAAACGGDPEQGADAADQVPAADSVSTSTAPAVAPDSVIAWATDIREGIRPLAERVAADPDGARQRAVELYVTRQERIEQAAGPGTGSPADLAESVHEAEARFHELMQLLGGSPPPDSDAVRTAVDALDARLAKVIELADSGDDVAGAP